MLIKNISIAYCIYDKFISSEKVNAKFSFYTMHEGKIKTILIVLFSRNHNLKETALILHDIFPIVIYLTDAFLHTTYYDHYFMNFLFAIIK